VPLLFGNGICLQFAFSSGRAGQGRSGPDGSLREREHRLFEVARSEVSVPHRGLDVRMAEALLNGLEKHAPLDHPARKRMAQVMEAEISDRRDLERPNQGFRMSTQRVPVSGLLKT